MKKNVYPKGLGDVCRLRHKGDAQLLHQVLLPLRQQRHRSSVQLNDFIASALNVTVSTFDPLQKISNDIEIDNPNQYTTALGLALRGLDIE